MRYLELAGSGVGVRRKACICPLIITLPDDQTGVVDPVTLRQIPTRSIRDQSVQVDQRSLIEKSAANLAAVGGIANHYIEPPTS